MAQNRKIISHQLSPQPWAPLLPRCQQQQSWRSTPAPHSCAGSRSRTHAYAIATLVKTLDDERLCVSAAVHLWDRGWGNHWRPWPSTGRSA